MIFCTLIKFLTQIETIEKNPFQDKVLSWHIRANKEIKVHMSGVSADPGQCQYTAILVWVLRSNYRKHPYMYGTFLYLTGVYRHLEIFDYETGECMA